MTKIVCGSLHDAEQNFAMLDLIPDTHVWIKDFQGHFVYGNRLFFERFGFSSLQGLLGKSDFELAPPYLADKYVSDDAFVLEGGVVIDRLELILGDNNDGDWFLTSKWPIHDNADVIIGSFGISRHLNRTEGATHPYRELRAPIDYIHRHFADDISVASLASACNISISALERRFRKHLKKRRISTSTRCGWTMPDGCYLRRKSRSVRWHWRRVFLITATSVERSVGTLGLRLAGRGRRASSQLSLLVCTDSHCHASLCSTASCMASRPHQSRTPAAGQAMATNVAMPLPIAAPPYRYSENAAMAKGPSDSAIKPTVAEKKATPAPRNSLGVTRFREET